MGNNFQEDIVESTKDKIFRYGLATFDRAFAFPADGLKPVNRRILYLLWEDRIRDHDKVAKVMGAVMKYHPHGDRSISDAIVKLGQWFTMNYPLIDPQGNFGTLDGDPASAPRYIECKPSDFAWDVLLNDIDPQSIDYQDNYDYKLQEPVYLPAKLPLVLVEGSYGIGEAFAASIPPHNLSEVIERTIRFIKNKKITNEELCENLYPDFPTGGEIVNGLELRAYYTKGVPCSIRIRSKCEVNTADNSIIIHELPYGVTFDTIKEAIFENKKTNKDESPFAGVIRAERNNRKNYFEIECKKDANPNTILLELLSKTKLESTRTLSMIVNYGKRVQQVTVKDIISDWYGYRTVTKQRKLTFEMNTLQNKTHILEGILKCFDIMDDVIAVIRKAGDRNDCIEKLHKAFGLTVVQARGICDMSVSSLSKFSKDELKKNIDNNKARIAEIIHSLTIIDQLIIEELKELDKKYSRPRRTTVNLDIGSRKTKSGDNRQSSISVENGLLLYSQQAVGLFDQEFLLHGKKINQGLPRAHRVLGGFNVGADLKGFVVFASDGTAQAYEISDVRSLHVWTQFREKNIHITSIAPITGHADEVILCLLENGNIKAVKPDEIGNRNVQIGKNVISCATSKGSRDNVIIIDSKSNYLYLPKDEFPILGRKAEGVKTSFEKDLKGVRLILMNSQSPAALISFGMDSEDGQGYTLFRSVAAFTLGKRTNKLKTLIDDMEHYVLKNGTLCVIKDQKAELILVGETDMTSLPAKHVKDTGMPRRTPLAPVASIVYL